MKVKYISLEEKISHFQWMARITPIEQEEASWVASKVGSSYYITKESLNFIEKAWWTVLHHMLSPTYGENLLSSNRPTLIISIIEGYEFDVAKWIEIEIHNWMVSPDTVLIFSCLLT